MLSKASFAFVLLLTVISCEDKVYEPQLVYGWNKTVIDGEECEACMPAGIKLDQNGTIFVSFPRWKDNVIATLTKFDTNSNTFSSWPSQEENKIGDADKLQSVLGFEIYKDIIYVLDQGKINNQSAKKGSLKVVTYNTNTGERNHTYDLSDYVDASESFLNDIVIDPIKQYAYISNSGNPIDPTHQHNPSILRLNLNQTEGKVDVKVLLGNHHYSIMPDMTYWLRINGTHVNTNSPMLTGVDGIALSCDYNVLYYTPLTSKTLYSIQLDVNVSEIKVSEAYKNISSDGILASQNGILYMTSLEDGRIYFKDQMDNDLENFDYKKFQYVNGNLSTMWPDTLAFYNKSLYYISNQLNNFVSDPINIDFDNPKTGRDNFRIYKVSIDDNSYIYGCINSGYTWTLWNIIIWIIFAVLILIVLSFVLMSSHKQEETVDKHMSIGLNRE